MIPGASKVTDGAPAPVAHCGYDKGIATANEGAAKTICCKFISYCCNLQITF